MSNEKYTEALTLFYALVHNSTDEANERFNDLLVFLHNNFEAPGSTPENIAECGTVLHKQVPINDILCIPPKVSDAVYPIALAKTALTDKQLPLRTSKIPEFDTFHNRYGSLILQSMSK